MSEVKTTLVTDAVEHLPVLDEVPEGATLIAEVDGAFYRVKGEGVGGMPEGGAPNQHLVTDADGVAMWEDKPFYETRKFESKSVYMEETVLSPVESPTIPVVGFEDRTYERSGLAHIEDANYAVIWNGVHYPFAGYDYKLVLGDGSGAMFFYGNLHILNDAKVAIDGTEHPMFEELTFEDTGEPFAIMKFAPRSSPLVLFSAADTIEGVVCEIVEGDFVETVKTLDPKFLPSGGGAFVVTLSQPGSSWAECDKTSAEIYEAVKAGMSIVGRVVEVSLEEVSEGTPFYAADFVSAWLDPEDVNGTPTAVFRTITSFDGAPFDFNDRDIRIGYYSVYGNGITRNGSSILKAVVSDPA